jgi:hypothetical protein
MEPQQYQNIYLYLKEQVLPTNLQTTKEKQKFKNSCNQFQLKNNYIYKKDKRKINNLLRVIRNFETEPVLFMMHNDSTAGHFAVDKMFEKIRDRYYWPQMYETIRNYVQTCDSCQRRGKNKNNQLLHPIPVYGPFYQVGIDIVGPLPTTENGNKYIVVAIDYLTKWPEARAIQHANAEEVSHFIYEEIICRHGCPSKILSDRGTHFKNQLVTKLMEKFQIKHLFSTPYHPQTNGLVERFNRTLCESLAKLIIHEKEWDKHISPVLFAYRTSKNATTKITPFYLTYGREAKLPVDNLSENLDTIESRLLNLIDNLPMLREKTRVQIIDQQTKQKDYHDKHIIREMNFQIGNKVLKYNAVKDKQWSGKLTPNWNGPYYIHNVLPHGAYKLRTMEGQVLKVPINGKLLKLYKDRLNWQPLITI